MNWVTVCTIVGNVTKFSGIALNMLLLYLITVYSRKSLGTYKHLLIVFASSDVVLTLLHTVIHHQIVSVGTMFCSVAYTFFYESRYLTAIYCASFTVVFCLSIFNFLYRLFAVKYPYLVQLYSNPYFIAFLIMIASITFILWYCLCVFAMTGDRDEIGTIEAREVYYQRFERILIDGFQVMDHWRDGQFNLRAALVLLACDAMIVSCITFAGILAFLCFYHIGKADKLSTQTKRLQAKLLVTLCAQTAVPITFVFIPYFTVITLPFFSIDSTILDTSCTALVSLFPTCDAIVIVALMTDYWEGLKSMLIRTKTPVTTIEKTNIASRTEFSIAGSVVSK